MNSITYGVRAALVAGLGLFVAASVFAFTAPASAQEAIINEAPQEAVVETAPVVEPVSVLETQDVLEETTPVAEETAPVAEETPATAPEAAVTDEAPAPAPEVLGEGTAVEEVTETLAPIATPELGTEEADYHPGETASIWGKLFGSLQTIVLKIFGSDENDQNYVEEVRTITTDAEGSFLATYQLDDLYRPFYEMVASTLDGSVLAEGWFRDSAVGTYDQCANDDGDGYATGDVGCRYTNGNLNKNNSTYYEGDSTVQRVWLKGYAPNQEVAVTFQYGTTKAGKHAYDFLTSWNHSEDWITNADLCQGIAGCTTASVDTEAIPQDIKANGHDDFERNFEIRGGTITDVSTPTVVSGSYLGDSETAVTVSFTVGNSGTMCDLQSKVPSCDVALFFGAHVSDSDDWAPELTAIDIPGSPYHVALAAQDGASIGQRDNQMQTDAIVLPSLGTLTLQKTVVNDNGGTAADTDWTLSANGPTPITGVEGDAAVTAAPVLAGVYTLSESGGPAGYAAGSWVCTGGVQNGDQITLLAGESATCVITNNDIAPTLTLVKTVVNDNGGTKQVADFALKIDGNTVTSGVANAVAAGAHTASEVSLPGYTASAWGGDCAANGSVTLALAENKTCTITNTDQPGHLIVHKVTVPASDTTTEFSITASGGTIVSPAAAQTIVGGGSVDYTVHAGTYSVSEAALAGWDETSNTCEDVVVANGETEECTITNTKRGTIVIVKDAVPNHIQDFSFTGSGSIGNFLLDDDGDVNNALPKQKSFEVVPGEYSVSEAAVAGWELKSATCSDGSLVSAINVAAGETVTCTFTNQKLASITLVKNTTGGDASFDFDGTGTGLPADIDLVTVGGTASSTFSNLSPDNTYSISENVPAGWVLTSASCTGTNTPDAITPNAGEHVVCTFANSKPDAYITIDPLEAVNPITKEHIFTVTVTQVPNGAAAATTADVDVAVAPTPDLTNTTTCNNSVAFVGNVATCTITINSSVVGDFVANATASLSVGGVALVRSTDGSGQNSGSATKTYKAGALEVTKVVVGLAGVVNGSSVDDTFTVTVTGPSYPSGHNIVFTLTDGVLANPNPVTLTGLIPGNYTITEADAGSEWTEMVPANAVVVAIDETAKATVTNTYVPGSLEVGKIVTLNGYLFPQGVDTSFTFEVTGPSYLVAEEVTINVADGVPAGAQTLSNLIPGDYTVTEVGEDTLAWTASGEGTVSVVAGAKATKAVTNSLKIPSTDITITPSVYETEPGQNVVLTITDLNNGATPITNPSVELYANNVLTAPQPSYVSGDANTNGVLDIGETWTWSAALLINANTTFVVNGLGTDPLGNPVNGPTYASETDSVLVRTIGATRTIGFWQTHTNFTTDVFEDYVTPAGMNFVGTNTPVVLGSHKGVLTTMGQVFGGFYAPIAKTTTGAKRAPVDQARVQMLQQLLAAKLNCAAFGCSAATQNLIAQADATYKDGINKNLILSLAGQLDAFNNSGDANAIPAGLPATGKATPKASQALADLGFWNQP